ncbi:MAG: SBBP repeat-containing protein, partial [Candidatus Thorarchaeota archaeon]
VHALDFFDNEQILSFDIEVDGSAPVVELQSPLNDTSQPPGRLIDISVTDPNLDLVRCHWDFDEYSIWYSPYHTYTPDGAGPHVLYIYANDTIGNEILMEYHFNVDDAIPLIELISPAEFGTYYPGTPIDVAVTNVTQEIDTILYAWDDNPNRSSYPFISIPAGEGWHSVTVYANNTLGLWATDTFTFYVHSTSWLPFSTYLGAGNDDHIESLAIDSFGNIYAAGHTRSTSYPVLNPYQHSHAGYYDGFVTKLGPNGTLLYSTFIGGGSEDRIMDVWIDSEGFCYIVGETRSPDYPLKNEFQNSTDVSVGTNVQSFVTKFNSTGNGLVFSTYIGGIGSGPFGNTYTRGIWADNEGNSYVGGWTGTVTFPSTLTIGPGGMIDAFVAKFDGLGNVTYITEVGGGGWEQTEGLIGDSDGNIYFTGHSISSDFPIVNGYDSTYSDDGDVIVAKLNSTGTGLVFSTFLGAENNEIGYSIDIDASRNVYICGYTDSENFTTYNALQEEFGGDKDWFIAKFNSTGNGLEYSTFYGANLDDYGATDIAVDSSGNAYVTGQVHGLRFHLLNKYQDYGLNYDAVVIKLNSTGDGLLHGTFLGGSGQDFPNGLCILDENSYYVGGYTESSDFPTSNAYDGTFGGNSDCFVTRVAIDEDAPSSMCYQGNNTAHQPSSAVEVEVSDTGIGLSHVMYSWNNESSSMVVPGEASYLISTSLPENETLHVLHISANDSVNNWYHAVYNFHCDITEPMIALDYPENGILLRSATEVAIIVTDLIVGNVEYQWDSSGWSVFNPPYQTNVPFGDGIHTLEVNATDQAGNWFSTIYYFQVDDTTPTIGHPSDISYSEGETGHDLVWSSSDTNLLHYELRRNGSLIQSNYFNHSISDFTFNVDEHTLGTYIYNLTIFDVVGNSVSDIALVVVVDTTHPEIANPLDVNYEWDSIGNEIIWSVFDYYPHSYNITRNGVLIRSGDWDGSDISLNVDGLHAGVYEFRLTVTDEFGQSSNDIVIVTVIDTDNPLISHPIDISYVEDTTGHSIAWEVSDDNPEAYIVYRDGTQVDDGQWDGFDIAINIDGLNSGVYNYTLVVIDGSHNQASDTVTVTVTPTITGSTDTTTPTDTTGIGLPPDPTMMLVLVASIAGVVLIAVLILVLKKRG